MTAQKKKSKLKYFKSKLIVWYYTKIYKLFSDKIDTEYLQFKAGIIPEKSAALQRLQKATKIVLDYEGASTKHFSNLADYFDSLPKVSTSNELSSAVSKDTMERHDSLVVEMHRKEEVLKTMINESSSPEEIDTAIDVVFFGGKKVKEQKESKDLERSALLESYPNYKSAHLSSKPDDKSKKAKTNKPKMKASSKEPKITKK